MKNLTKEQIKSESVDRISKYIRAMRLIDDGYVWVNRIVDYKGGDNYAVRQIHPNLPDTEGTWLSTNTMDIKGGRPYEEELNYQMSITLSGPRQLSWPVFFILITDF